MAVSDLSLSEVSTMIYCLSTMYMYSCCAKCTAKCTRDGLR